MDEPDLPRPRPVLDCLLALDGIANVVKVLVVDEALQSIALREPFDDAFAMLERAARQIARDAGIKNAIASIGHEVEPAAFHAIIEARRGWPGQVPGHDVERFELTSPSPYPPARSGGATLASV